MGKKKNNSDIDLGIAKDYFDDFFETGSMEYIHKGNLVSMIAIVEALQEIRDELRKMNGRSEGA